MKTIKTAIASYGMSGLVFHGPLLKTNPHFEVTSIFERKTERSKVHFPDAKIVRSFDELINDHSIELIIINTPDHLHFNMAKHALEHDKHVIIEKPFTQTAKQAEELIKKAKERKLKLSVFQNRRWDSDFLTIQKVIANGKLGRLVEFESHFDRFRNYLQDSWKEKSDFGSGNLYNLGPHLIDQALMLFGLPEAVYADVRKMRTNIEVDDYFEIIMYYSHTKVTLKSSYLVKEAGPRFILHGTEGSFIKYGIDPQEQDLKDGIMPGNTNWGQESKDIFGLLSTDNNGETAKTIIKSENGNYPIFYENVYNTIRNGEQLLVNPVEAKHVIKIIEMAYESSKLRKAISF